MQAYDILIIGSTFIAFITSLILFARIRRQQFANRFLCIVIFSWGWYALLYLLIITGGLREVPHIWRLGSPLYYLIPPCGYLYVRKTLYRETSLRKAEWLHFLPAALHFTELLPFYLAPLHTKQQIVNAVVADTNLAVQLGSGLIPAFWHYKVRPFTGIAYIIFLWPMVIRAFTLHKKLQYRPGKQIVAWVLVFSVFITLIYSGMVVQTLSSLQGLATRSGLMKRGYAAQYLMGFTFLGLSLYLFFKPEILYGISRQATTTEDKETSGTPPAPKAERVIPIDEPLFDEYLSRLKTHIEQNGIFRKQGISINEVATELKIPIYHLSNLVNRHYHRRFTDFINMHRIAYVQKRIQEGGLKELTLEGLAKEAGFSSRSAFFAAFKKETGFSPSDYKRQLNAPATRQ